MTLRIQDIITVATLSTGGYASTTSNSYFNFSGGGGYAAQVRLGTIVGTGQIDYTVAHAVENINGTVTPSWQTLLTGDSLTTTSAVSVQFESQSTRPLLPYGRLQVVAKSGAAGAFTVAGVVAHVLAELK